MGFIQTILLLAVIAGSVTVVRTFLRVRKERKLRDNYPEKRVIEIKLPNGTDQARFMNASFWSKVASVTTSDPKARAEGMGQIDFKYVATVTRPKSMPVLSCLICADADKMDGIKKALKTVYEDIAVIELEEDPLRQYVDRFRPQEGQEPEYIQ